LGSDALFCTVGCPMPHLVSLRLHASQAAAESDEEFADSPYSARLAKPEMERADGPQLSRVSDVRYRVDVKLQNLPSDPDHPRSKFQVGPSAHTVVAPSLCNAM